MQSDPHVFTVTALLDAIGLAEEKHVTLGKFAVNFYRDFMGKSTDDPIGQVKAMLLALRTELEAKERVLTSQELAWLQWYRNNLNLHINATLQKRRKRQETMARTSYVARKCRDILTWEGDPYAE